jgi:GT2 family glycosyltransferase
MEKLKKNIIKNAAVIVLNFNGNEDTICCTESVKKYCTGNYNLRIYVVDNGSDIDNFKNLKRCLSSNIICIRNDTNLGYAAGNNIGIKAALSDGCDYLCILNNDTIIFDDFLEKCINYINNNNNVGIVGPTLIDYNSNLVQSAGAEINLITGSQRLNYHNMPNKDLPYAISADYVGGACMVFSKKIIDLIGYLPECYFLFYEETEWCIKAKKIGLKNICLGNCQVIHRGSVSIKKINGLNEYLLERNKVQFMKRNTYNSLTYIIFLAILFLKNCAKVLIRGKKYCNYFKYDVDGMHNIMDYNRFPFIIIR